MLIAKHTRIMLAFVHASEITLGAKHVIISFVLTCGLTQGMHIYIYISIKAVEEDEKYFSS